MEPSELVEKIRSNLSEVAAFKERQKQELADLESKQEQELKEVFEPLKRRTFRLQAELEPFCVHPSEERRVDLYLGDHCRLCGHFFGTMFGEEFDDLGSSD